MLISAKDAEDKLNSPHNLINKMRGSSFVSQSKSKAMSLFGMNGASRQENKIVEDKIIVEEIKVTPFIFPTPSHAASQQSNKIEPDEEISVDDIMNNADNKIKIQTAHDEALAAMVDSVQTMRRMLGTEVNPVKLADIASKMSKIVGTIRNEQLTAAKLGGDRHVHLHLYNPEQKKIEDFKTIDI